MPKTAIESKEVKAPKESSSYSLTEITLPFNFNEPHWKKKHMTFFNTVGTSILNKEVDLSTCPSLPRRLYKYKQLIIGTTFRYQSSMLRAENPCHHPNPKEWEKLKNNEKKLDRLQAKLEIQYSKCKTKK